MKRIIIIGYYENDHDITYIKCLLESYSFDVYIYPLYEYIYDQKKRQKRYWDKFKDRLKEVNPEIFLWFFYGVPTKEFLEVREDYRDRLFTLYNRDDPFLSLESNREKSDYFDIILTVNPLEKGENTYYLPPGINPQLIGHEVVNEYQNDISIFYSTVTDGMANKELTDLKSGIISLCSRRGYSVKLYGPKILKSVNADIYGGMLTSQEKNWVYNRTKINIVLSNEEVPIDAINVVASGNFLMINKRCDMEKVVSNKCFVYLNNVTQIKNFMDNYYTVDSYKKRCMLTREKLGWDVWVERFLIILSKRVFSYKVYREINDLDFEDEEMLRSHWMNYGLKKRLIFFDYEVPDNFNHVMYADVVKKPGKNIKFLYYHWYKFSKDKRFLTKNAIENDKILIEPRINVTTEQMIGLNNQLNKIAIHNRTEKGLDKMIDMLRVNENIEIDEAIGRYVQLCMS